MAGGAGAAMVDMELMPNGTAMAVGEVERDEEVGVRCEQ